MSPTDLIIIFTLLFYLLIVVLLIYWVFIAHKIKRKTFFSSKAFLYILIILFTIGSYLTYRVVIANKNITPRDKISSAQFPCNTLLSRAASGNPDGTFLEDCKKYFCTLDLPVPPFAEASSNFGKLISQSYPSGSYSCDLVFETVTSVKETSDWYKAQIPWINNHDKSSFYDASDGFNAESEICSDTSRDNLYVRISKGYNDVQRQKEFNNNSNNKGIIYVPLDNTENTVVDLRYEYYTSSDVADTRVGFFDPPGRGCRPSPFR